MGQLAALDPAGPNARAALDLWWLMLGLGGVAFVLFVGLLAVAVRRRDRPLSQVADPRANLGNRWIFWGGVALPVVLVGIVFGVTIATMAETTWDAPADAVAIDVESYQFGWTATHTDAGGAELESELVIPVGHPVAVNLTSLDVIHSFWVPQLAGKMDALPDGETTLVIQADEPGEYPGRCAEFCGLLHAEMPLVVVALDDASYEQWRGDPASVASGRPGRTDTEGEVDEQLIEESTSTSEEEAGGEEGDA